MYKRQLYNILFKEGIRILAPAITPPLLLYTKPLSVFCAKLENVIKIKNNILYIFTTPALSGSVF